MRSLDNGEWRAVHVGVLSFDFLNDETAQRWVSEDSPGRPLSGEANDERTGQEEKGIIAFPNAERVVEQNKWDYLARS